MERKMLKSRRVTRNNIDPLLARRRGLKMLEPAHHSDSTKRDLRAGSASAMEKRRMAARFSSFGAGDNGRDGHGG